MFAVHSRNKILANLSLLYTKTMYLEARFINTINTESLEPIDMSYATYESTGNQNDQSCPFIIVHGLFGSKSNWNSMCKYYNQKLNPSRKIISVDTRNHGDTPHSDLHTYAHLAADIKTLYGNLNIKKAAIMGHSMGGKAVMLFALKYPELVERLIVIDIAPITYDEKPETSPDLIKIMKIMNLIKLPSNIPLSQCRSKVDMELSSLVKDKAVRDFLLTNLVKKGDGSFQWRINVPGLIDNYDCILNFPMVDDLQYDGPTLFMNGRNSDFVK